MNREQRRKAAQRIARVSKAFGEEFVLQPHEGGTMPPPPGLVAVYRNKSVLVQVFAPAPGTEDMVIARLGINLIALDGDRWLNGIPWEQLQRIKDALPGFKLCDAIEVYPRQEDIVNAANMRHLWVLRGLLPFAWRKS